MQPESSSTSLVSDRSPLPYMADLEEVQDVLLETTTPPVAPEAFCGIAGRIVEKLQPQTESHPMAILLETLVSFGNVIGRSAHYEVEDTRHFGNLFVVKVGKSSKARKGTARARVDKLFSLIEPKWAGNNRTSGLSSGEGLIELIRDDVWNEEGTKVVIPGVADKRLYVQEEEFARILSVGKREGNVLSDVIRCAWDSKPLRSKTRNSPLECQEPHLSLVGDITQEELLRLLSHSDSFNGFANRFLWVYLERTALRPFGGREIDWNAEAKELRESIACASKQRRIFMDRNARLKWGRAYGELSQAQAGQFGAATSRAEAQVIRLALLYALLDRTDHIEVEHLNAALAVWSYCRESARILFGGLSKEQQIILDALDVKPMTASEIREQVFHRNRLMPAVLSDLSQLASLGHIQLQKQNDGVDRYVVRRVRNMPF
jgi:hypothetical protein